MKVTVVHRTVDLFIGIFAIAGLISIARSIASIYRGEFGTVKWPVQAESVGTVVELADNSMIRFYDGELSVTGQPLAHAIELIAYLGTMAIFLLALFALRKILSGFAEGEIVVERNAIALRKVGWLLFGACGISILQTLMLQPIILAAVAIPDQMALHPSISWDIEGVSNIWLHYSPPLVTFLLGGLALSFAAAIRAGAEYRQDSESVI